MFDKDKLRERFEELETLELLQDVFLNRDDYNPEAMAVITEVLESRCGGLQKLYSDELEFTGKELERFSVEKFLRPSLKLKPAKGELVLTTNGLGFYAMESQASMDSVMLSAGVSLLGLMVVHPEPSARERGLDLPISLLSQLDPFCAFHPLSDVEKIVLRNNTLIVEGRPLATARLPDDKIEVVQSWARQAGLPTNIYKEKKGFFARLFGG